MNASSSTTSRWLHKATSELQAAGIATARLDALVLLEDICGQDRSQLLAHPDTQLSQPALQDLDTKLRRRVNHEPLAYIRGKTEFYGREFTVNAHTLEPRPETEDMIDLLKELELPAEAKLVDVGTGSGAIGITAALELGTDQVTLIDIDDEALAVARQNTQQQGLQLTIILNDLLDGRIAYNAVLANLPYVPDRHTINEAALQEPAHAIFGGPDGLDLYRKMFVQLRERPANFVLTESLPFQHETLASIATAAGYKQTASRGFIQLFSLQRPPGSL